MKHLPDKKWVLMMLSTFTPNDEIFHKSYVPPAKIKKVSEMKSINLPTQFIKSLPPSKKKIKVRRLGLFKQGIKLGKIDKLNDQLHRIEKKIILEKEKQKEETKASEDKNQSESKRLQLQFQ